MAVYGMIEQAVMICGICKNCHPLDRCNGDCKCSEKQIEVSADDDIRFYGEQNNEPCERFSPADQTLKGAQR